MPRQWWCCWHCSCCSARPRGSPSRQVAGLLDWWQLRSVPACLMWKAFNPSIQSPNTHCALLLTRPARPPQAGGRLLVRFKSGSTLKGQSEARLGVRRQRRVGSSGAELYTVVDSTPTEQKLKQLKQSPGVLGYCGEKARGRCTQAGWRALCPSTGVRRAPRACHLSCAIAQVPMMTGNCLDATSSLPGVTPEMCCFESSQGLLQQRRTDPARWP